MSYSATTATRCYRIALRAFPPRLRRDYGEEMEAAFATSHALLRADEPAAARAYLWRATLDAVRAGLRERFGRAGVRSTAPGPSRGEPAARRGSPAQELLSDVRFAVRSLRHAPGFVATVVLVLALGVGINGAIFTALEATLLSGLPYPHPENLYVIDYTATEADASSAPRAMPWSWPKYQIMAAFDLPLDEVAAYATSSVTFTGRGDAARLQAEAVTARYFATLGIELPLGRAFVGETDATGLEVVLSAGLWQERFGGADDVIGETVTINGQPVTIVGVAPAGFNGLSGNARLWVPVPAIGTLVSPVRLRSGVHWLQAIGRADQEASEEQLRARIAASAAAVEAEIPLGEAGTIISGSARSLAEARRNPRAERAVLVVAAAAGLVLLIACVNLAALMLARGADRRREIAVRLALGGSRFRIARGLVCESVILSLAGGVLGTLIAAFAVGTVAAMWPTTFAEGGWNLSFVDPAAFALDGCTLAYTLTLGLAAGAVFGIGPALRLSRADLGAALKEGDKASSAAAGLGARRWLVTAEVAAALVLLVGAALLIGSLMRLLDVDTGINEDKLLVFEYSLPRDSAWAEDPAAFHEQLLARIRALPQVEDAAGGLAPLVGLHWSIVGVTRVGDRELEESERRPIGIQSITEDYFATLQTPVVRGRAFDSRDQSGSAPAILINETAARELFGDADPVGASLAVTFGPTADGTPAEIVGVVGDVLYDTREKGVFAEAYFLQRQVPLSDVHAIVRTRGTPYDAVPAIRGALADIDPDVAAYGITSAADLAAAQVSDTRVLMQLLAVFAGLALLLAATGIWGVVSCSVAQRRRELGIRLALGAHASQAVRLVLQRGLSNALIGVAVGLVAALALTRYIESLLYEVDAADPAIFVTAATLLVGIAGLAAWIPALRATRVDPTETLRSE